MILKTTRQSCRPWPTSHKLKSSHLFKTVCSRSKPSWKPRQSVELRQTRSQATTSWTTWTAWSKVWVSEWQANSMLLKNVLPAWTRHWARWRTSLSSRTTRLIDWSRRRAWKLRRRSKMQTYCSEMSRGPSVCNRRRCPRGKRNWPARFKCFSWTIKHSGRRSNHR